MSTRTSRWRRRRVSVNCFLISSAVFTGLGLLILTLRSIDPSTDLPIKNTALQIVEKDESFSNLIDKTLNKSEKAKVKKNVKSCATVEEMGEIFSKGYRNESLRVRRIIQNHFALNGASRVRGLSSDQFCRHGFVIGKASEAGLGNEMYKILTAAALSVMLNRSLIIGQTRGKYPFGDYISYSNVSFTLKEVKHLWRQNGCLTKYGRHLVMRIDDFQKPARTNVLCSNWREWDQPIIWFQNTTDAVAAQFFLKNIHTEMRKAASNLFGMPENLELRPNVFGELMRVLISPSENVQRAVNWALNDGADPDIALHMRMLMNRSVRAVQAALGCFKKAVQDLPSISKPKVVLVSDTPSTMKDIAPNLAEFAEVLRFDYEHYGNISGEMYKLNNLNFRVKDWGPAPRWVAFVDFFLASRAKHAVISGANRRVGTTYAQLIAALAAANRLEENSSTLSSITFFSSFHSNLLSGGLRFQVGWGHIWNRFAGQLSCHNQSNQCALTPLLPPAWWDGLWQSPLPRDIRRMEAYGVRLSGFGTFDDDRLNSFCSSRKNVVVTVPLI
ncbi:hypothetical protein Adt_21085 [Abeliophyllum distichum]|uniref:Uncharacterized protein n=1 Tax=Abeliophyllum distichum TaxID=126358 RepID=A0ABD1SYB4_9LAMI